MPPPLRRHCPTSTSQWPCTSTGLAWAQVSVSTIEKLSKYDGWTRASEPDSADSFSGVADEPGADHVRMVVERPDRVADHGQGQWPRRTFLVGGEELEQFHRALRRVDPAEKDEVGPVAQAISGSERAPAVVRGLEVDADPDHGRRLP